MDPGVAGAGEPEVEALRVRSLEFGWNQFDLGRQRGQFGQRFIPVRVEILGQRGAAELGAQFVDRFVDQHFGTILIFGCWMRAQKKAAGAALPLPGYLT